MKAQDKVNKIIKRLKNILQRRIYSNLGRCQYQSLRLRENPEPDI